MTIAKVATANNVSGVQSRILPDRELTSEELAPYANYSSYRLRDFARAGIIKSCRKSSERHGAWLFQPAAALAEISKAHKASKAFPISIRKSPGMAALLFLACLFLGTTWGQAQTNPTVFNFTATSVVQDNNYGSTTLTMINPGSIVVQGSLTDTSNNTNITIMVKVDGVEVARSIGNSTNLAFFGISSSNLAAGSHTITFVRTSVYGATNTSGVNNGVAVINLPSDPTPYDTTAIAALTTALTSEATARANGDAALAAQYAAIVTEIQTDEGKINGLQSQIAGLPTQTTVTSLTQQINANKVQEQADITALTNQEQADIAAVKAQEQKDIAALQARINELNTQLQATNQSLSGYQKKIPAWQMYGVPAASAAGAGMVGSILSNSALMPKEGGNANDSATRPGYYDR